MHSLLARQLKRALKVETVDVSQLTPEWQAFVAMVEHTYTASDVDRNLVQRSIEIASGELVDRNQQLVSQYEKLRKAELGLRHSHEQLEQRVMYRTAELREAKEAAERIKERFYLLLNSTGEGIYGIDTDGNCSFANNAAAKMLGYSVDEMLGCNMHMLIHHKHCDGSAFPICECPIYAASTSEQKCSVDEDTFWTRDEKPIVVQYSAYPMRDGNTFIGSVIAFSDISGRKIVETQLRRAKEIAERASQTKSEFLARMSHEIRTPLNGVIGMIDQLEHSELGEHQRKYTSLARVAAESLLAVISDILDFSKIEAGRVEVESVEVELNRLVSDLVELFRPVASKKQVVVAGYVSPEIPRQLITDAMRLRQILVNLIGNAIKFTPTGSVTVQVSSLGADEYHHNILIEVVDTGIGIPEDRIDRLFKSFSQVDNSITRKFGGTGLGLAICKRLVELMGGQIGIRSQQGQGTTFWFTLPMGVIPEGFTRTQVAFDAASSELPAADAMIEQIAAKHLLVVDDNEMNQFVTEETLKRASCTCEVVGSGQEAIEAFKARRFDAILMDCQMPEMDGFETSRRIREMEASMQEQSHIPIIALTAEAIAGDRERCVESGMDGYVTKPIKPEKLYAEIQQQTRPREAARATIHERIKAKDETSMDLLALFGDRCALEPRNSGECCATSNIISKALVNS